MTFHGVRLGLLALIVSLLVLDSVRGARQTDLAGNAVEQYLSNVRDRGRSFYPELSKNSQLASLLALDSNRNELVFDVTPYIRDRDIHAEQYLLEQSPNIYAIPSSGYVFLFTHLSPCVQGCISSINIFAEKYPNLHIYVGFERFYGNGDRTADNELRKIYFVNSLETRPPNVKYMYIPKTGNPNWVTKQGLTPV